MTLMREARYRAEAEVFHALAHPVRLQLLDFLAEGPHCACEIEPEFSRDQSTISRHLIALKRAGLVQARREGVRVIYHLSDARIQKARELIRDFIADRAREHAAVLAQGG
uniref:Transcriptional regulator, ArsR family n=2 Tax=Candidatus Bipolaricaulota TaxID=67810 RepID=H5SP37_9BACT|nr:transcriptional regulator, ArsR family [uncultured Acetothermia bacterium]BAL59046.1 transcriptional regulator, ArsR family [Candidatus Acetothermum autotrophicum]